jgi:hypothetical protein
MENDKLGWKNLIMPSKFELKINSMPSMQMCTKVVGSVREFGPSVGDRIHQPRGSHCTQGEGSRS